MKKILSSVIIFMLVLSTLVACVQSNGIKYKDGNYTAQAEMDDNGWRGIIDITIKDHKIIGVSYDEFNAAGDKKSKDEEYSKSMEDASGVAPTDAFEQLEDALVTAQSPKQIDAVAGATESSETFKKLAEKALNK